MLKVNHTAPETVVTLSDGSQKNLLDFWQDRKLLLVFLRHLGWLFCREQVAQLRRTKNHLDEAGFQVVLVGMGTTEETAAFKQKFNVPFAMVSDPEQRLYKEFELGRMSLFDALKPGVVLKAVSTLVKGHGVGIPIGDIRQLPGVFIITTDGKIAYGHYADNPADHPDPQDILNIA